MSGGETMGDGNTVDSLQIEIEASSAEAEKKVNALVDALERLKKATTGFGNVTDRIRDIGKSADSAASSRTNQRAEALKRVADSVKEPKTSDTEDVSSRTIQEKIGLWNRLKETIDESTASLKKFLSTERMTNENSGKLAYGADSMRIGILGLVQTAKDAGLEIASALGKGAIAPIKVAFKALVPVAKAALNGIATAAKAAASGLKKIGETVVSKVTSPFKNAVKAVTQWKAAIGRIMFYRSIRSAIKAVTDGFKEGIDNLYQYSKIMGTSFAPAMDKLATSALYLKNSLGAMAAPLIEAIAPAVDYLVDKFVELLNIIGKTFAALTGKSVYSQAKKYPVEYAEAAEEATKKTKEFKKFLLGIDELNIMPDQKDDAGDLKKDMLDYASMFEEVEVPVEEFDWARQIREAIENGDWYSVGRIVAEKLNEILSDWDSYAWGKKLGELITNGLNIAYGFLQNFNFLEFGSKIAQGINGLFDWINWDLLGRTIAEKWNALFNFIYGFATNLNWAGIGTSIAEAINGFLDWIDATRAAQAISSFVTGLFDMINNAITGTDWALLGRKLAEFINNIDWYGAIYGALSIIANGINALKTAIDAFLADWDWKDTATQIYTAINDAWNNVDWMGVGKTLADLLVTAFQFGFELLSGIDWMGLAQSLLTSIVAFIGEIGDQLNITSVTDTIVDVVMTVANVIETIIGQTSDWLAGLNLEPAAQAFDALLQAINPLVETIADGLAWAWENILLPLAGWFIEESVPANIELLTAAFQALNDVLKVLSPLFEGLWNTILKPLASFIGGTFIAAINGLAQALNGISSLIQSFMDSVSKAANAVSNFFSKSNSASASSSFGGSRNSRAFSMQNPVASALSNVEFAAPKAYASGGFPARGEMFIAREAGPELVGKIGQKNTVANNEQIVSGIADGVADANTDVVNAVYAIGSMIVKAVEDNNKEISLDGEVLTRKMQPYQNRLATMQGTSLVD